MDGGFAGEMKRRRLLAGLSLRALAATTFLDAGYLSRIESGLRHPPERTAKRIDEALGAEGELAALAGRQPAGLIAPGQDRRPLGDTDVARLHGTVAQLVALDTAHGSEGLHVVAARAFRQAQEQLAVAGTTPSAARDVQAAVAEVGEVAAWLAYDAEDQELSRRVATEALLVARCAGDRSMERFILSQLAMQAVYVGHGAEALAIADRVLAEEPRSSRVAAMFRLRRARALGALGDRSQGLAELERARRALAEGPGQADPQWTWWLHEAELSVHEARLRATTGDVRGAVEASERAVAALPAHQGRDGALYRAWLLHDLVGARAWRDAERVAAELVARPSGSARVPRILRDTLGVVSGHGVRVPRWLVDEVRAAADATAPDR